MILDPTISFRLYFLQRMYNLPYPKSRRIQIANQSKEQKRNEFLLYFLWILQFVCNKNENWNGHRAKTKKNEIRE